MVINLINLQTCTGRIGWLLTLKHNKLNKDYSKTLKILNEILDGKTPKPGSYRGRVNNEPENNRKTLLDLKNA